MIQFAPCRAALPFVLFAAGTACVAPASTDHLDDDGDGLTNGFELTIGTNVDAEDTDGDGCADAVEVLTHFDATDAADHPYTGVYPRGPQASDARMTELIAEHGEGYEIGQVNPNWTLADRYGDAVELRDFYGQVVLIDLSSEWCAPCVDAAIEGEQVYQELAERGLVVLQILLEGPIDNSEPDAARWSDELGLTFPVVGDHSPGDYTQTEVAQYYLDVPGASYEIPNFTILDREQRVRAHYVVSLDLPEFGEHLDAPVPPGDDPMPDNAADLAATLGLDLDAWRVSPDVCD